MVKITTIRDLQKELKAVRIRRNKAIFTHEAYLFTQEAIYIEELLKLWKKRKEHGC